ncbi:MAG: PKD domain-containing protein [Candidatus Competibacteraceae bacterium]|nr:PKD domain-containing protein [Candidatus Competibacteraceae bacterium]
MIPNARHRSILLVLLLGVLVLQGCPPPAPNPPTAAFTASPSTGAAPLSVQFDDRSTPSGQPITTWAWSFGDGGTSTDQEPVHVYATAGSYTVSLTVTSADGSDIEVKSGYIHVTADPNWAPDTTTFNVEVAPDVELVEEEELASVILQYNPDEHAYLLDLNATDALGLDLALGDPLVACRYRSRAYLSIGGGWHGGLHRDGSDSAERSLPRRGYRLGPWCRVHRGRGEEH